jgi:hypothetical protein
VVRSTRQAGAAQGEGIPAARNFRRGAHEACEASDEIAREREADSGSFGQDPPDQAKRRALEARIGLAVKEEHERDCIVDAERWEFACGRVGLREAAGAERAGEACIRRSIGAHRTDVPIQVKSQDAAMYERYTVAKRGRRPSRRRPKRVTPSSQDPTVYPMIHPSGVFASRSWATSAAGSFRRSRRCGTPPLGVRRTTSTE